MNADIRFATHDHEKEAIYRLRYELYVEEQGLFQDEADHARRWLRDACDDTSHHLLAEVDGELVGTMRLTWGQDGPLPEDLCQTYLVDQFTRVIDPRDIMIGTRFLVREKYRGGTLAFQLMWRGFEFVGENNVELLLGNCEPHLVSHYRKLGFRPYGGLYDHPTNGVLVRVAFVAGDLEYLHRIRSPMLLPLSRRTRPASAVEHLLPFLAEEQAVISEGDGQDYWSELTRWLGDGEHGLRAILGDLSRDDVSVLVAKSHILACDPGQAIIRKGHVSRTLYILVSGSLEVHDHGKLVARVTRPGSVVGEVAFFTQGERMSDVLAGAEGARVLSLNNGNLRELISGHGPTAARFLHFVARGLCDKLIERARAS